MQELELKLRWENGASFELTSKLDAESVKKVVYADENGRIGDLWEHIQTIVETYVRKELEVIGRAMKQ